MFLLALVIRVILDNVDVTVTVNGVEEGSYTNSFASSSGQEELFEVCVPGAAVLIHVYIHIRLQHTLSVSILDSDRDGTYDSLVYADGYEVTGTSPAQGDDLHSTRPLCDEGSDCDDMNAGTIGDDDGDGTPSVQNRHGTDAAVNPDGVEVYYDGVDQDCDGMSDFDQDMDGVDIYEVDCDGEVS